MDTYQVRFCETTQERYDQLTKEPGTLYFTSDTKRLYKGNQLFASELTEVYDNNSKFLGYAIAGQTDKPLVPASLLPAASDDDPKIAGTKSSGTSGDYSRADHVHPAETEVGYEVATPYNLSSNALPITFKVATSEFSKNSVAQITESAGIGLLLVAEGMTDPIAIFDKDTGFFTATTSPMITDMAFGGREIEAGVWPRLDVVPSSVKVRDADVQLPLSSAQLANIEAASTALQPATSMWYETDTQKYNDNAGGSNEIHFKPSEIGLLDGGKINEIWFHTATTNAVNAIVYLKLMSNDGSTVYATSDAQSINFTNDWAKFTFSTQVALSRDTMYKIGFFNSTNDAAQAVRARLSSQSAGGNPNPYWKPSPNLWYSNTNLRPHLTVIWTLDMDTIKSSLATLEAKVDDHESRIATLESALEDIQTALQQINNGGQS